MKHQSKENRASIVLFLLFLCFVTPRAKSQVLLENDSSDVCKVIDIVNVGLSTEIQKDFGRTFAKERLMRMVAICMAADLSKPTGYGAQRILQPLQAWLC